MPGESILVVGRARRRRLHLPPYTAMVDPNISGGGHHHLMGSIRGVPEAARRCVERARKPVVAAVTGVGASAAYWIIANASAIESSPSGSVGAIGIITERVSVVKQLAADGVDVAVLSAGKFKAEGHPATPMTDAERKAIQSRVDVAYTSFVNDVSAGRHVSAASVRSGFGEGRLVDAPDAFALGMIDRIATLDSTLAGALAQPATLMAMVNARAEQLRASTTREQRDHAQTEIAAHRDRLRAAAQRVALR